MIRDLLTPEAQRDPYAWAAVLVAHAGIGVALWVLLGSLPLALTLYAGFEAVQALVSRRMLLWDSLLDWSAVGLGVSLGWALAAGVEPIQQAALVSISIIAAVGARVRSRR